MIVRVSLDALLVLAVGLAMDAAAVSAAKGLAVPVLQPRHFVLVAGLFGGAQALMPLLGWGLGASVGPLVAAWDHWIAFGLLSVLGAKLLWEARSDQDGVDQRDGDPFAWRTMLVLAVATSIDALAVGVTLPLLDAPLLLSLVTIGTTTALLSVLGLLAGRRFGRLLGKRLDAFGGLMLIGLGAKILFDHLRAA